MNWQIKELYAFLKEKKKKGHPLGTKSHNEKTKRKDKTVLLKRYLK